MSPPAAGEEGNGREAALYPAPGLPGQKPPTDPAAGQTTGLDGYSEDDVPMMHVGPPTQADPNQVSTKPRQLPNAGNNSGPDTFDPASIGGDVAEQRAEGNDTSTNDADSAGDEQPGMEFESVLRPRLEMIASQVLADNPQMAPQEALGMAYAAFGRHLAGRDQATDPLAFTAAWDNVPDGPLTQRIGPWKGQQPIFDHKPYVDQAKQWGLQQGKNLLNRVKQRMTGPGQGQTQGPEEDEWGADPEPAKQPETMGEWARRQMDYYGPEARRDLWKMRHSTEPFKPVEPHPLGEDEW